MSIKKNMIIRRKNNPFFSIITVVKNDEKYILKTISSISNQTYKNYEYIIIDGLSKDNTVNKILLMKKYINRLVSKKDKGIYYAMNRGIDLAKGEIIVFVNSGDTLTKNALKLVSKKFNSLKNLDFVFGTVKRHYLTKSVLKYGYNPKRLLYNFDFATAHSTGFFIKRNKLLDMGKFSTKYRISSDYDIYYKAIIKKKFKGSATSKNNLIGIVQSGGYSSKFSFFQHLLEETKIRLDNNQNIIFVYIVFLNAIIKFFLKKLF
tara:strand:- start:798 stop:1583 length:786 start_codon:yes stop_codon:yes gene_type:complete